MKIKIGGWRNLAWHAVRAWINPILWPRQPMFAANVFNGLYVDSVLCRNLRIGHIAHHVLDVRQSLDPVDTFTGSFFHR